MDLIIDACGWTAAVDANVNLDHALLPLVGRPTWLVPKGVREELGAINLQRRESADAHAAGRGTSGQIKTGAGFK